MQPIYVTADKKLTSDPYLYLPTILEAVSVPKWLSPLLVQLIYFSSFAIVKTWPIMANLVTLLVIAACLVAFLVIGLTCILVRRRKGFQAHSLNHPRPSCPISSSSRDPRDENTAVYIIYRDSIAPPFFGSTLGAEGGDLPPPYTPTSPRDPPDSTQF